MRTQLSPKRPKRGTALIFGPCLLFQNGSMDQDATWYGDRPRPRPHCVRGTQLPLKSGTAPSPLFDPYIMAEPLDGSGCHLVRRQASAQAILYTTSPIIGRPFVKRFALCFVTVVCLSVTLVYRQHCVRWGPSSSSPKGTEPPPQFLGPCLLWPNGWMDQDATW